MAQFEPTTIPQSDPRHPRPARTEAGPKLRQQRPAAFTRTPLILLSLAWRIVDKQNEQAIVTKITRRVFLACAYLTGGDAPDWRGAAVDCDVTGALQPSIVFPGMLPALLRMQSRWLPARFVARSGRQAPGEQARSYTP